MVSHVAFSFGFCPLTDRYNIFVSAPFFSLPPSIHPPSAPFLPPLPLSSLPLSPTHSSTTDYRLVIICSNEDEDKSHIISRLSPHKKHFTGLHNIAKYREYLKIRFTGTMPLQSQTLRFATQGIHASIVDLEEYVYCVGMCMHMPTYVDHAYLARIMRSTFFFLDRK